MKKKTKEDQRDQKQKRCETARKALHQALAQWAKVKKERDEARVKQ